MKSEPKSELCYLIKPKKPVEKAGLSFLAKVFTSKYSDEKVGILTKHKSLGQ